MTIAQHALPLLLKVGREVELGLPHAPTDLDLLRCQGRINCLHWGEWDALTGPLQIEDVVRLAKALTIIEKMFRWPGGSVAAVIWVFREVARRDNATAQDLADWILARTDNPFVPFGSRNHGARSLCDLHLAKEGLAAKRSLVAQREASRASAGQARKAERKRMAVLRMEAQSRSSAIRRAWEPVFLALPPAEQLRQIAHDTEHPLNYFPVECAGAGAAALLQLDPESLQLLRKKLEERRKGPWTWLLAALYRMG
jgi:hypothetical protein